MLLDRDQTEEVAIVSHLDIDALVESLPIELVYQLCGDLSDMPLADWERMLRRGKATDSLPPVRSPS